MKLHPISFVLFSYSFQMTSEFADTTEALVGYLTNGGYPPSFTPSQKRSLRRTAKHYVVMEQKLHYKTKDSKKMLEVIAEEGERRRILAIAHSSGTKYITWCKEKRGVKNFVFQEEKNILVSSCSRVTPS